jgi:hypothetical protein
MVVGTSRSFALLRMTTWKQDRKDVRNVRAFLTSEKVAGINEL